MQQIPVGLFSEQTKIGLDVGRSAVKAKALAQGKTYELIFPAVVSLAIPISDEETAMNAQEETVEVNGKKYFTGDTARVQSGATSTNGLSNDWTESIEYQALVLSAMKRLRAMGVPGMENPLIVIGTPAAQYRNQRRRLEDVTKAIVPGEVKALSQPMGAYLSWAFTEAGIPIQDRIKNTSGRKKSWAVVDIGYFSTDFLLMREGNYVESKSQSCEGLHLAAENLVRLLADKNMPVTHLECEQALRTKTILHFGERNVGGEVREAAEHVVLKIREKAQTLFSDEARSLDGILIAGGGAPVVTPSLQTKWPNAIMLPQPRMSVADGFLRHARSLALSRALHQSIK